MPPQIALVLCTAFVLFLLRLSSKQFPEVSYTLWIPTIYMLMISSKPLGIWFGIGGVDMEAGSPLDRAVLSVMLCLSIVILFQRQFSLIHAIHENPWITILIGYMFISIFWSDIPFSSFKRWVRELVPLTMAFLLSSEKKPLHALQCVLTRTIYILIPFSLMLIKYYPNLGVEYGRWSGDLMWIGVASQKNGLALVCLISFFFLIWTLTRRWRESDIPVARYQTYIDVFLLLLTIWIFLGPNHTPTYSATSTIALTVGLTAFAGFLWMKKHGRYLGAGILMVIIVFVISYGTITPFVGKLSIIDVSSAFGRDETLTERTVIWASLVPYAMKNPLLGHGYGGFWNDKMRRETSSHAHNGYLDTILDLGIIGVIFFSVFLVSSCKKAYSIMAYEFDWSILWICFLLMAAVHNIAESSITSLENLLVSILLFLAVCSKNSLIHTPVLVRARYFTKR
ncbi:MAG: O-antigen ligase family protein [Syntrophobacteraceae bacterium]